jgi:hypothetical protein
LQAIDNDLLFIRGKTMKICKFATGLVLASTVLFGSGSISIAGERVVGVVAINYDSNNNIRNLSTSIAVGKTAAAATASIDPVTGRTATSAIGGAGRLTVTNSGTANVGYAIDPESNPQAQVTGTVTSNPVTVKSTDTNKTITVTNIP